MDSNRRHFPIAVQVVSLVALAVALAGFILLFGIPGVLESAPQQSAKRAALEDRLGNMRSDNDFAEKISQNHEDYDRRIQELRQQLEAMRRIVPDETLPDQFQASIAKDAAAAGLRLLDTRRQAVVAREFYAEAPFQFHVRGNYDAILRFCNRIDQESRISSTSHVVLAPLNASTAPGQRTRLDGPFDATFTVTTYFTKLTH